MATSKYTLFDEAQGCNQQLPVNDIVDRVTFGRIYALQVNGGGDPLVMPLSLASPVIASYVAAYRSHAVQAKILQANDHPIKAWGKVVAKPYVPARQVEVSDVEALVTGQNLTIGNKKHALSLPPDKAAALMAGNSVRATVTGPGGKGLEEIILRTRKLLPSHLPMKIELTQEQMLSAAVSGKVFLPGYGEHKLNIGADQLRQFNASGMTVAKSASTGSQPIFISQAAPPVTGLGSSRYVDVGPKTSGHYPSRYGERLGEMIDAQTAQDWFESIHFQLAVYIVYQQDWTLLGYSRGAMVNSFALAPQEELTLDVFSWDRTKTSTDTDFSMDSEALSELTTTGKGSFEAVLETKKNENWKPTSHVEINLPFQLGTIGGTQGVDSTVDNLNKKTVSYINEAVSKTSNRIKSTRQVKINEAKEVGSEDRSKRFIRNPNMCQVLHFDYYEVLENYSVTTSSDADKARLCVLMDIPDSVSGITNETGLLKYEGILRGKVPKGFDVAFDSALKLVAFSKLCDYKCPPKCDCDTAPTQGQPGSTQGQASTAISQQLQNAAKGFIASVNMLRTASLSTLEDLTLQDLASIMGQAPKPTAADWANAHTEAWRAAYRILAMEGYAAQFWSECTLFADNYSGTAADIPSEDIAAIIAAADSHVKEVLGIVNARNKLPMIMIVQQLLSLHAVAVAWLLANPNFDNAGLDSAFNAMRSALQSANAVQPQVASLGAALAAGAAAATGTTSSGSTNDAMAQAQALAEAEVVVGALVDFITLNTSHYNLLIWNSFETADQLRLLTAIMPAANKYLLPNVLGIVGDKVAVEFNMAADPDAAKWLKGYLKGVAATEVMSVTLPSPGVSMQTRLGQCDACEPFIEKSRAIELQRLQAVADQQGSEAKRMSARVQEKDYADPIVRNQSVSVTLDKPLDKPA